MVAPPLLWPGQTLRRHSWPSLLRLFVAWLLLLAYTLRGTSFLAARGASRQRCSSSLAARGVPGEGLPPLGEEDLAAVQAWEERERVLDDRTAAEKTEAAAFPIPPEELVLRAKHYLAVNQYEVVRPELLSDDFQFLGPIIGPLDKVTFMTQLTAVNLRALFPDATVNFHHFRVDPFEPSRVWCTCRNVGSNLGAAPPLVPEATGKHYESPPESISLRFNEAGQVNLYTGGYVLDRSQGNTGGLGGVLGPLYAIGKGLPFPEAQPFEGTWQYKIFQWLASVTVPNPSKQ